MEDCRKCGAPRQPGAWSCPYCHIAFANAPPGAAVGPVGGAPPGVREALEGGNKIEAIRLYRQATGASLRDAKDAVEALEKQLPRR